MQFRIHYGFPDIAELMDDLVQRRRLKELSIDEIRFHNKLGKTFSILSQNPRHNSLQSHEIEELSIKFGKKVFQSYLENKTPAAGRIFWAYGPKKSDITILAIEHHPENSKRGAYKRIKLADFPKKS